MFNQILVFFAALVNREQRAKADKLASEQRANSWRCDGCGRLFVGGTGFQTGDGRTLCTTICPSLSPVEQAREAGAL